MEHDNKHIDHALLAAYITGETDEMQTAEVDKWLSLSEENAVYLKSMELLWTETGKLSPPPVDVDSALAWQKVSEKLNFTEEQKPEEKADRFFSIKHIWQAAAMIIVIFGAYGIFKLMTSVSTQTLTSENTILTDTLTDGSIVKLNKNSSLTYPEKFERYSRKVQLKGEAFFEVEHNNKQSFEIEVSGAYVKVLGTSFNVKEDLDKHTVEVYVETGIVKLYTINEERDTSSVILQKGETGTVKVLEGKVYKPEDIGMNANEISWMNDTFVFDGVSLEYVAEFLESFYAVNITFSSDSLKDLKLTASFKNDNIDEIMEVIAASFNNLNLKKENYTYCLNENNN